MQNLGKKSQQISQCMAPMSLRLSCDDQLEPNEFERTAHVYGVHRKPENSSLHQMKMKSSRF